jgi:hypothetical protein
MVILIGGILSLCSGITTVQYTLSLQWEAGTRYNRGRGQTPVVVEQQLAGRRVTLLYGFQGVLGSNGRFGFGSYI